VPRQHGAWAMLAVPLLLGVAVTRPSGWYVVLGAAAGAAYLAMATAQVWVRVRGRQRYTASLVAYFAVAAILWAALVAMHPALLLTLLVLIPASAATLGAAALGRGRGLASGLAQVTQALVLLPAAASMAGPFDPYAVAKATFLAAAYLIGTLLAVRSVIREQGRVGFAAVSVSFHVAMTAAGVALLPRPFVLLLGLLAIRAALLPIVQWRRHGTANPLRPIHLGIVEMILATCVVGLAFVSHL
jgi:hypothetical protein